MAIDLILKVPSILFLICLIIGILLYLLSNGVCMIPGKYYLWNFSGLKAFKDNKKNIDDK